MNNIDSKITNPLQLKRELAVKGIDGATAILRNCEWQLVVELKERLFSASFYTELGERNEMLVCLCVMLLRQVRHFVGGDDQSIINKGLSNKTIDELLAPHDMLHKLACTND